jgi:hypothetical protein
MPALGSWPTRGAQLAWTLVTLAVSWGIGQYLVKHEFIKRLHARFHGEGIVIISDTHNCATGGDPAWR